MKQFDFYLIVGLLLICGLSIYIFGFGAEDSTLLQLRISKILCAVLCGGALASAGVMLQNLLKNPLADPYILGTSSGGALGIMAAVLLGYSSITLPFYFFVVGGAFLAILTVCSLGGLSGKSSAVKVILAGVAVNIFLSSVIMLIVFLLKKPALLLVSFMLGAVTERPLFSVLMSSGLILVGFILALLLSRQADILSLGEEQAEVLGANIKKLRYAVLFCVALLVGGGIGLCGAIGFVGFIVPHIARIIMGPKVRGLLFASALLGAAFLVNMEVINRLVFHPRQVPVGILCAALGAPFFLWVLLRSKGEYF